MHRPRNPTQDPLSLREEPFFRGMSDRLLMAVEHYVFHRAYETRQIIYFPEDPCDYVYWVREGRVKVTRVSGDGRELTFRHLLPGDMLGEECLINAAKRGAYAEAMARTVLCQMRADDFRRVARDEAEVSVRVAQRLCQRALETETALAETVFKPVRARVAACLARLHARTTPGPNRAVRVTHQELANLVGATRETTTGVLHALKEAGMVRIGNRRIEIVDPAALALAAEEE